LPTKLTNDKYKISIALCTYNGAKYLPEQLESFLRQTRPPDELVIGDDCSTDETAKLIEDFAKVASFSVELKVNQQNLGSTKNFERTIERCAGNLIFLADQDDVWLPQKIARIVEEFEKKPNVGLFFSNAELVNENLEPLKQNLWDFTFDAKAQKRWLSGKMLETLLWQNVVTGATAAFRAEFRAAFTPLPTGVPNLIHDAWIALVIADHAKIEFINECLIKYRQHSGQQLGVNFHSSKKKSYAEREKHYAETIAFLRNEKLRLARLSEFFDILPQVAERRNIIGKFILEKQQLIEHYETRKNLPRNRIKRWLPVSREILSGRYRRFSRGFLSAAKDSIEKW
jgi:glycosyltransferase involved in cell wall biosynthesis